MNSYEKAKKYIIEKGSLTPKNYYPIKQIVGPTGPTGISDTIEVGNIYTTLTDTEAKVVDTTGGPHHILDFYIPKGSPDNNLSVYGGIYHNRLQLVTINAINEYVPLKFNSALSSKNVTTDNNSITVLETGIYEINYNILLNANQKIEVGIALRRNEKAIPESRGTQTVDKIGSTNISYDARLSGTTLTHLTAHDKLDLALQIVSNLPDNLEIIINNNINATLSLKKIASV